MVARQGALAVWLWEAKLALPARVSFILFYLSDLQLCCIRQLRWGVKLL
jgi:hypothetical protein